MQLAQLLGGTELGMGLPALKSAQPLSDGVFSQDLEQLDEQIQGLAEELGLSLDDLSPEMLAVLRQWMAGGAISPQAASSAAASGIELPPLENVVESPSSTTVLTPAAAPSVDLQPLADMAMQLGQSLVDAAEAAVANPLVTSGVDLRPLADMAKQLGQSLVVAAEDITTNSFVAPSVDLRPLADIAKQLRQSLVEVAASGSVPASGINLLPLADIANQLEQSLLAASTSGQVITPVPGITPNTDLPLLANVTTQLVQSLAAVSEMASTKVAAPVADSPLSAYIGQSVAAPGFSTAAEGESLLSSLPQGELLLKSSVAGMSEKLFTDMASRLSDAMPQTVVNHNPNQVQIGAVPLTLGETSGQSFNQVLTNNLLAMGVPQKITDATWPQAMGDRLLWMVKGDQQMAELKITPPNLGTIEVKLTINHDQASVSFVSNHAAVRDAIEQAIPRLREMMQDESINLTDVDVGERHRDGQASAEGDQERHAGDSSTGGEDGTDSSSLNDMQIQDASGLGLIDLFA